MLDGIVLGALFLKLFPKAHRKKILFKARKRIQVSGLIRIEHISFFKNFRGYLNFKLFKVVS